VRILSGEGRPFEDRVEAGRLLGGELARLPGKNPVVLGIPRGGLVVAHALAQVLEAELDAVFTLKLRSPENPEFSFGAVAETGKFYLTGQSHGKNGLSDFMKEEIAGRLRELGRRTNLIRRVRPRVPLAGRTVIVTDDGVFTGSTMLAALGAAGAEGPRRLIAAIPVCLEGRCERLAERADEVLCLRCPPDLIAVSQLYRHYPQVEDREILRLFQP
jgi:predicted phosphoribosyltransferase